MEVTYISKHSRDIELDIVSRISAMEIQVESVIESQRIESEKLDTLLKETARYRGFIGGVLFICACLAAFIKFSLSYYLGKH